MAREVSTAEELFVDVADGAGWTKRKQLEILLAFIDTLGVEDELSAYLDECTEDDDGDDCDPFDGDEE